MFENLHIEKQFVTHIYLGAVSSDNIILFYLILLSYPQISLIARSDADIAIFGGDLNAQVHINFVENTSKKQMIIEMLIKIRHLGDQS